MSNVFVMYLYVPCAYKIMLTLMEWTTEKNMISILNIDEMKWIEKCCVWLWYVRYSTSGLECSTSQILRFRTCRAHVAFEYIFNTFHYTLVPLAPTNNKTKINTKQSSFFLLIYAFIYFSVVTVYFVIPLIVLPFLHCSASVGSLKLNKRFLSGELELWTHCEQHRKNKRSSINLHTHC